MLQCNFILHWFVQYNSEKQSILVLQATPLPRSSKNHVELAENSCTSNQQKGKGLGYTCWDPRLQEFLWYISHFYLQHSLHCSPVLDVLCIHRVLQDNPISNLQLGSSRQCSATQTTGQQLQLWLHQEGKHPKPTNTQCILQGKKNFTKKK